MGGDGQAHRLTGANGTKPVWYRKSATMPATQIAPARYWAIFRQPPAFDWMTAPLRQYRAVKTNLSCPSPEPATN